VSRALEVCKMAWLRGMPLVACGRCEGGRRAGICLEHSVGNQQAQEAARASCLVAVLCLTCTRSVRVSSATNGILCSASSWVMDWPTLQPAQNSDAERHKD